VAQRLWAAEQALRCAAVDAVLVWFTQARAQGLRTDQLRRLQMAAAGHNKLLFVMRDALVRKEASPAVLRLEVLPASQNPAHLHSDALEVRLHKRRGPVHDQPLHMQARAAQLTLVLAASRTDVVAPARQSHALDRTQRA
jgi:protein ImuA